MQLFSIFCVIILHELYGAITRVNAYNLTIIHNNDFHSHFAPFDQNGAACSEQSIIDGKCYGGVARTVAKVKQIKEPNNTNFKPNVLFLNAGDHFQGTVWYSFYKWHIVAKFVKLLKHDAMALGNHEFDDGIDGDNGLALFVKNMTELPILSCNIDTSNEPLLDGKIKKSIVIEVGTRKIAIIGYITPETRFLSSPGNKLKFNDEIESIKMEIQSLKQNDPKINIFIALGHSGLDKDKEIANKIPDIDVVVGGHSHSFLYSGDTLPSDEIPVDKYPVVFKHDNGQLTLVVQAYCYGKYLGKLDLEFNDDGNIVNYNGSPILMDQSQSEDPDTLEQVKEVEKEIKIRFGEVIGLTMVELTGGCRTEECNLGNLITDAFIDYYLPADRHTKNAWTIAAIAIVNGGLIRAGISIGNITWENVITASPFGNELGIAKVPGHVLLQVLETSVANYDTTVPKGNFLQMSGIKVRYDITKPKGNRVINVLVRCADCLVPKFEDINKDMIYDVITTDYIAKGGDGYDMLPNVQYIPFGDKDFDIIGAYIKKHSPITIGIDDRIVFVNKSNSVYYVNSFTLIYFLITIIIINKYMLS